MLFELPDVLEYEKYSMSSRSMLFMLQYFFKLASSTVVSNKRKYQLSMFNVQTYQLIHRRSRYRWIIDGQRFILWGQ
jgi:hypothetical protein